MSPLFLQGIGMGDFTGRIHCNARASPQFKYLDGAFCAMVVDASAFGI